MSCGGGGQRKTNDAVNFFSLTLYVSSVFHLKKSLSSFLSSTAPSPLISAETVSV